MRSVKGSLDQVEIRLLAAPLWRCFLFPGSHCALIMDEHFRGIVSSSRFTPGCTSKPHKCKPSCSLPSNSIQSQLVDKDLFWPSRLLWHKSFPYVFKSRNCFIFVTTYNFLRTCWNALLPETLQATSAFLSVLLPFACSSLFRPNDGPALHWEGAGPVSEGLHKSRGVQIGCSQKVHVTL